MAEKLQNDVKSLLRPSEELTVALQALQSPDDAQGGFEQDRVLALVKHRNKALGIDEGRCVCVCVKLLSISIWPKDHDETIPELIPDCNEQRVCVKIQAGRHLASQPSVPYHPFICIIYGPIA